MQRIILSLLLIIFPVVLFASTPVLIQGMQVKPSPSTSRVTFFLDKKTFGKIKFAPNPNRLIVEFPYARKQFTLPNTRSLGPIIQSINTKMAGNTVYFTFFLSEKVHWKTLFLPGGLAEKTALHIDIFPQKNLFSPQKFSNTWIKNERNFTKKPQKTVKFSTSVFMQKSPTLVKNTPHWDITVVIDPGHGGKDSGAIGPDGAQEKNVVLAIARQLKDIIDKQPNMHAILTRDNDYFLSLNERLLFARKHKADLFIAIHADAHFNRNARGVSVYALSQHGATSVAARWLAVRQNHEELGGITLPALQDQSAMLRSVLIDLAQTTTSTASLHLGRSVLNALDDISMLHYTHIEQAPFLVLKSPDIPSILVETGFISNPKEEKQLTNAVYQAKIAQGLCRGINQYVKKYAVFSLSARQFQFIV